MLPTLFLVTTSSLDRCLPSLLTDVSRPDALSAADIQAVCLEAGMQAVRKNRYVILSKDFEKGYKKTVKKSDTDFEFYQ